MVEHMIIITGGTVDREWLKSLVPSALFKNKNTKVMAADRGLFYAEQAGIRADYVLGDFDSVPKEVLEAYQKQSGDEDLKTQFRIYPPEKDYTDTHLAFLWAMEEGAKEITVIGGMGTRFDHSFANIGLLSILLEKGIKGEIIDPNNRIFMMDGKHPVRICKNPKTTEYISLIPYTERVTGITLEGFRYPLYNETLTIGISRGISNELVKEDGVISVEDGILIVCVTHD